MRMSFGPCREGLPRHERARQRVRFAAATVVEDGQPVDAGADADDAVVLGEACSGNSEIFVTGDAAVLRLKSIASLEIV